MKHIFILKPDTSKSLINCIVTMMQGKRYELRYTKDLDDARKIALSYQDEKRSLSFICDRWRWFCS